MKIIVEFESKQEFDEYMGGGDNADASETKPARRPRGSRKTADATAVPDPEPIPGSPSIGGATVMQSADGPTLAAGGGAALQQMTPQMFGGATSGGQSPFGGEVAGSLPPGPSPAVQALLQRVASGLETRLAEKKADGSAAYDPNAILGWFRTQCGQGAESATFDQIKQSFLPRMQESQLEQIAKMIGA